MSDVTDRAALLAELDRLRNELKTQTETVQYLISERTADREHWGAIEDSLARAERILAALPNPIARKMLDRDGIDEASDEQWREAVDDANRALRAAVAAAEQEVGRE